MTGFFAPFRFAFWAAILVGIDADPLGPNSTCHPLHGRTFKFFVDAVNEYVSWGGSGHYMYAYYAKADAAPMQFHADPKNCNTYKLEMQWKGWSQWLACTNSGLWLAAYNSKESAAPFLFEHIAGDKYSIENLYETQLVGRNGKNWWSYTGQYNEVRATSDNSDAMQVSLQEQPKKFKCNQSYPLDGRTYKLFVHDVNKYVGWGPSPHLYPYMYADFSKGSMWASSLKFHADYDECNTYKLSLFDQWVACTNSLWLKFYGSESSAAPFLFEDIGGDQYRIKNSYEAQLAGRNGANWLGYSGPLNEIRATYGNGSDAMRVSLQEDPHAGLLLGQLKLTPFTGAILAVVVASFSVVALVMRRRFASQSPMTQGLIESEA